jgi:purine-binding chemotaxis protein CheW
VQIVSFEMDRRRFGVPAAAVERLLRAAAVTPTPGAPDVVEGVLDLAGAPVAVLDLRRRFGLRRKPMALSDVLIVTRSTSRRIALRADRVIGMQTINQADLHPPAAVAPMALQIAGVALLPDGVVLVQDPDAFLTAAEGAELDAALAEAFP